MNLFGNWKLAPDEVLLIEAKPPLHRTRAESCPRPVCSVVKRTELVAA